MSSMLNKALLGLGVIFATSCQMSEPKQTDSNGITHYNNNNDLTLDVKTQSGSDTTFNEQTKEITMNGQSLQYKSVKGTYSGTTTDSDNTTTTVFNKSSDGTIVIAQKSDDSFGYNYLAVAKDSIVITNNKMTYIDLAGKKNKMDLVQGESFTIQPAVTKAMR